MAGKPEKPHYHGHRARLRQRFLQGGAGALQDYELLELLLTFAIPYSDVKPLAKSLIAHFGSFTRVFDATPEAIMEVTGLKEYSAVLIRLVKACAEYYLKEGVLDRQKISSLSALVDYCRTAMGGLADEQFRVHLPQQPERNHRRRDRPGGHRQPDGGLPPQGPGTGPETQGHRPHPGAQPPQRQPHPLGRRPGTDPLPGQGQPRPQPDGPRPPDHQPPRLLQPGGEEYVIIIITFLKIRAHRTSSWLA